MAVFSLPPVAEHSLVTALSFIGIALMAWMLDFVVTRMRQHHADALLCRVFHVTALGLAILDCALLLYYAMSSAMAALIG